jgi:hypothetical protein
MAAESVIGQRPGGRQVAGFVQLGEEGQVASCRAAAAASSSLGASGRSVSSTTVN